MSVPTDVFGFIKAHHLTSARADEGGVAVAPAQVLSVYVPSTTNDHTHAYGWRMQLRHAFASARNGIDERAVSEREAFEACVRRIEARLADAGLVPDESVPPSFMLRAPGWMALAATDGELIETRLAVAPDWSATWGEHAVIMPYLVAMRADDAVIVLIDHAHATIARLLRGVVHPFETLAIDDAIEVGTHMGDAPRAGFHTGTRGETATDSAQRQRRNDYEQLIATVQRKLAVIAGATARIVIGGAPEVAAHFLATLPGSLATRAVVSEQLQLHSPFAEIPEAVQAALMDLLTRRQLELLATLERRAHLTRNAAFGLENAEAAASAGAIERLIIAESVWRAYPEDIEALAQQALRGGADVEVASPACADALEAHGGVAAELRFVVPPRVPLDVPGAMPR